jgi:sulfate permease, SulP family
MNRQNLVQRLSPWLPFLLWQRPDSTLLKSEALAGVTVGLMLVPQGIAYASLAGMPLITGIYASMLPALIAVLFSASPRLSVGPTALTCLMVSASLTGLAAPGSARWIELAMWLALLSGVLQIALGYLRSGWLLSLVNAPVLMAFTQGAAVLIIGWRNPRCTCPRWRLAWVPTRCCCSPGACPRPCPPCCCWLW